MRTPLAVAAALLLVFAVATPVSAECVTAVCGDEAPMADEPLTFGVAFVARIVEASTNVDEAPPGADAFDFHVGLEVTRIFRGKVPDLIEWNGYKPGSETLIAQRLRAGDTVFVAAETFDLAANHTDPFGGDVVVWRKTDLEWSFAPRLLTYSGSLVYYPAAARAADSLGEILAVVRAARLPDTSAAMVHAAVLTPGRPELPLLVAALVGLLLGLGRTRRQAGGHLGR